MSQKNGNIDKTNESDEEDYEIYFLQPASSPYNMKEKLKEANKTLFETNLILEGRQLKVKFKEELVDYEPDLTDDDVQSIESYNEVDYILEQEFNEVAPRQPGTKIELNIFTPTVTIHEEDDENDDDNSSEDETESNKNVVNRDDDSNDRNLRINEEQKESSSDDNIVEEEIEEKIETDQDSYENIYSEEDVDLSNADSSPMPNNSISEDSVDEIEDIQQSDDTTETKESSTKSLTSSSSKRTITIRSRKLPWVDCKAHCIERLDAQLDLTISKLQINEKPLCPTLKLLKRRCCEKNQIKKEAKLPCYSGLRSEYGLSLQQLEKKQRREEVVRMREAKRRQLLDEYKNRKMQQNEEIFSQWLQNLQKRKQEQTLVKKNDDKKMISPKVLNIPNKYCGVERPKTCYSLTTSHNVKKLKRPNTSTACVFIQVPQNVLKKGLHVGDIIVTSSKNVPSPKGLHILSIS